VKPHSLGGFTTAERLPIPVELRLTDEYRNATWELAFMGKTRLPFGPHLATNTEELTRALFTSVTVTTNTPDSQVIPNVAALLIPQLVYVDLSGRNNITMALEWSLFDASHRLVWVDSFRAEVRGPVERVRGVNELQRRFDLILENLFRQSHQGMLASPDIRRFAQSLAQSGRKTD
jgi:hypothetical protein